MNINSHIREWAETLNESSEFDRFSIDVQITGGHRDGGEENGHQLDKFYMPTFDTNLKKWIVLSVLRDMETLKTVSAERFGNGEYDIIDDAVAEIRDMEDDNSTEDGE